MLSNRTTTAHRLKRPDKSNKYFASYLENEMNNDRDPLRYDNRYYSRIVKNSVDADNKKFSDKLKASVNIKNLTKEVYNEAQEYSKAKLKEDNKKIDSFVPGYFSKNKPEKSYVYLPSVKEGNALAKSSFRCESLNDM